MHDLDRLSEVELFTKRDRRQRLLARLIQEEMKRRADEGVAGANRKQFYELTKIPKSTFYSIVDCKNFPDPESLYLLAQHIYKKGGIKVDHYPYEVASYLDLRRIVGFQDIEIESDSYLGVDSPMPTITLESATMPGLKVQVSTPTKVAGYWDVEELAAAANQSIDFVQSNLQDLDAVAVGNTWLIPYTKANAFIEQNYKLDAGTNGSNGQVSDDEPTQIEAPAAPAPVEAAAASGKKQRLALRNFIPARSYLDSVQRAIRGFAPRNREQWPQLRDAIVATLEPDTANPNLLAQGQQMIESVAGKYKKAFKVFDAKKFAQAATQIPDEFWGGAEEGSDAVDAEVNNVEEAEASDPAMDEKKSGAKSARKSKSTAKPKAEKSSTTTSKGRRGRQPAAKAS